MILHRIAAAVFAVTALGAHAADPTAALNRSFVEYTGAGPIGNNGVQNLNFYWVFESTGTYMSQQVNSWFLMFDPNSSASVNGSVTFDSTILYVHDDKAELVATAGFQKAGVAYNYTSSAVGLETGDKNNTSFGGSVLTLSGNGWTASSPGDHIRVMTAVPEPGTYALMAAGLAAIGFVGRRRRA